MCTDEGGNIVYLLFRVSKRCMCHSEPERSEGEESRFPISRDRKHEKLYGTASCVMATSRSPSFVILSEAKKLVFRFEVPLISKNEIPLSLCSLGMTLGDKSSYLASNIKIP
jgi:hypothetical protein